MLILINIFLQKIKYIIVTLQFQDIVYSDAVIEANDRVFSRFSSLPMNRLYAQRWSNAAILNFNTEAPCSVLDMFNWGAYATIILSITRESYSGQWASNWYHFLEKIMEHSWLLSSQHTYATTYTIWITSWSCWKHSHFYPYILTCFSASRYALVPGTPQLSYGQSKVMKMVVFSCWKDK